MASDNKATNVPKSADFDQVMNKLNLTMSKHSSVLNSLRRSNRTTSSTQAGKGTDTTNTTTTKAKSSFSAMANKPPSAIGQKSSSRKQYSHQAPKDDDDFGLPVNVGVGYVASAKDAAESAETRDLKGRLLGKRAREQKEEAKKKRARRDESSDEEEGRSAAVGKGRKRR
ncbi:hypothetical protein SLS53_002026 [Cytospora paraplurivora]|uniref:Uncharacterized protein n=1 Tax=Cytospora paraplurivora TaxID=2898453 RepID=A0AAN9YJ08_9PEZI